MDDLTLFELNSKYGDEDNLQNNKVKIVELEIVPAMTWEQWLDFCSNRAAEERVYAFHFPVTKTLKVFFSQRK